MSKPHAAFSLTPDSEGFYTHASRPDIKICIDFVCVEGARVGLGKSFLTDQHLKPMLAQVYDHMITMDDVLVAIGNVLDPYSDPDPFGQFNGCRQGPEEQAAQTAMYAGYINGALRSVLDGLTRPGKHTICVLCSRLQVRSQVTFSSVYRTKASEAGNLELREYFKLVNSTFSKLMKVARRIFVINIESIMPGSGLDEFCYQNMAVRGRDFEMKLYPSKEKFSEIFGGSENAVWPTHKGNMYAFSDMQTSAVTDSGVTISSPPDESYLVFSRNQSLEYTNLETTRTRFIQEAVTMFEAMLAVMNA